MKYLLPLLLVLSACASTQVQKNGMTSITNDQYLDILEDNSDRIQSYSGFYNTLDVRGTINNSQVAQAQLLQNRRIYEWTEEKFNSEKALAETRLSKSADFFVSFFTPEKKNDDLIKVNTTWRLFLDVDGRRYEGKAIRMKLPMPEIEGVYPYHNRFATPYTISFPVSMRSIEGKDSTLTITGPVGTGIMKFKAIQ
jgi:hypothetical protein